MVDLVLWIDDEKEWFVNSDSKLVGCLAIGKQVVDDMENRM
jgi:hypothetical protein